MSIPDQLDSKPVASARIRKVIESECGGARSVGIGPALLHNTVKLRLKSFVWEVLPAARDPDKPSIVQAAS
jgi:hypothetical protein